MSRPLGLVAVFLVALALVACGDDAEGPAPDLVRDVERLQRVLGADTATPALAEVDEALDDHKQALAAELLRIGAAAAARRSGEEVAAVEVATDEGRRLREKAARACRKRATAIEAYADALDTSAAAQISGDPTLADAHLLLAIDDHRTAEHEYAELLMELEAIRPLPEDESRTGDPPPGVTPAPSPSR